MARNGVTATPCKHRVLYFHSTIFFFFLLIIISAAATTADQRARSLLFDSHGMQRPDTKDGSLKAEPTQQALPADSPESASADELFNASAHEVPSGPNPIANR